MLNITAATTSARFAVVEFIEECAQEREGFEVVACAFVEIRERELEAERVARYEAIRAKYDALKAEFGCNIPYELFSSDEYWFMRDYEEEQWRNSDAYAESVAWLHDPANYDSEIYSDVFKDVYGFRPRGYRPC